MYDMFSLPVSLSSHFVYVRHKSTTQPSKTTGQRESFWVPIWMYVFRASVSWTCTGTWCRSSTSPDAPTIAPAMATAAPTIAPVHLGTSKWPLHSRTAWNGCLAIYVGQTRSTVACFMVMTSLHRCKVGKSGVHSNMNVCMAISRLFRTAQRCWQFTFTISSVSFCVHHFLYMLRYNENKSKSMKMFIKVN